MQRFGQFNFYPYLCINKKKKIMDYIILTRGLNGTYKIKTFSDGTIPFYHDRDEAAADMGKDDVLFKVEKECA